MTDLLLKFPSEDTAGKVGEALGCAALINGKWEFATTHKVAICPIGEHFIPTGKMIASGMGEHPEYAGDGNFWALARIMVDMTVPEVLLVFLVERNADDATQSQHRWA